MQPVGTMQRKHVPIPVGTSYIEQKNYLVSLLISNLDHADRFSFLCYCLYCNNIKGDYNRKIFVLKMVPHPRQSVGTRWVREKPTYITTNFQSLLDVLLSKTCTVKVLLQTISKETVTSKRLFV